MNKLNKFNAEYNVSMALHTSFKAGGEAECLCYAQNEEELKELLGILTESDEKHFILGNGTNVLFKDSGFDGIVVKLCGDFESISLSGNEATVGSAVSMATLAKELQRSGLAGFEPLSGIPGSVGGAC